MPNDALPTTPIRPLSSGLAAATRSWPAFLAAATVLLLATSCGDGGGSTEPTQVALTLSLSGDGAGTVTSSPAGIACTSDSGPCEATFESGTVVALTATPASGDDAFVGWSGPCSGAGACSVTLSAATTVSAEFDDVMVTTRAVGAAGGTVVSPDGALTLVIPAGALDTQQEITVRRSDPASLDPQHIDPELVDNAFDLGPDGLHFDQAIEVRLRVPAPEPPGPLERRMPMLIIQSGDGSVDALGGLAFEPGATAAEAILTGRLDHFSTLVHLNLLVKAEVEGPDMAIVGEDVVFSVQIDVLIFGDKSRSASVLDASTGTLAPSFSGRQTLTGTEVIVEGGLLPYFAVRYEESFTYTCVAVGEAHFQMDFEVDLPGDAALAVDVFSLGKPFTCKAPPEAKLTIHFEGDGSGTVTSDPAGIDCQSGEGCTASFPEGTVVTLTAMPDEGSVFCGWTGGGGETQGAETIQVTMDMDGSVTACFDVATSAFSWTVSPSEISGTHTVGSSPCPQHLSPVIRVENTGEVLIRITVTPSSGLDASPKGTWTISPGAWLGIDAIFTCEKDETFTGTITIDAEEVEGDGSATVAVPVTVTVVSMD